MHKIIILKFNETAETGFIDNNVYMHNMKF